jgi:hypothetical protein
MEAKMKVALVEYGEAIRGGGWGAGERLIVDGERRFRDFRRWAYALGIMLRANEILQESNESGKSE